MARATRAALAISLVCATAFGAPAGAQPTAGTAAVEPLTYVQSLSPSAVQIVQEKLTGQGAYAGAIDGIWAEAGRAALSRYQQTHGLQDTGQLNEATAVVLGIAPADLLRASTTSAPASPLSVPPPPPPIAAATPSPPEAGTRLSATAVRNLQSRLRQLGYYDGASDGQWGPGSEAALTRFQQANAIPASGRINPQTVTALGLDPNNLEAAAR